MPTSRMRVVGPKQVYPSGLQLKMLTIRSATDADVAVASFVIRQSFNKQAEILAIRESEYPTYVGFETESRARSRVASAAHVALAFQDNEAIGTVSCAADRNEITRLAVLPAHRGHDFGRNLMEYAEARLRSRGAGSAEVSIVSQFARLQSYYERLGYSAREIKRFSNLPFDVLVMVKPLT